MNAKNYVIIGFTVLSLCCVAFGAQLNRSKKPMSRFVENPVLGIAYNPSVVHYETVSDEFRKLCPKHDYKPQAIYAHVRSGNADYYVTAMIDPRVDDDASITITLVNNGTCVDGDIQWAYSAIPSKQGYAETGIVERIPGPSATEIAAASGDFRYEIRSAHEEWILRSLDEDAILRGIKAHGSETEFARLFCASESKYPRSDAYPIEKQVFSAYCAKHFHK